MSFSDFGSPFLIFFSCTLLLIYALYKFATWSYNLEKKLGISGPKPVPLFGNSLDFNKHGAHVTDVLNHQKYGHIYPIYLGQLGVVVISDEALLKQVLVKEAKSFIDRPWLRISSKLMRKNLLQLKGKDWERVRSLVTPVFTSGKLKKMYPMILTGVQEMLHKFAINEDSVDVKELFGSLTMDVIAKTMFGIDIGDSSKSSNAFLKHAKKLFDQNTSIIWLIVLGIFPRMSNLITYIFPNGIDSPDSRKFFQESLTITIKARQNSKEKYHDFLALMLKAHDLEKKEKSKENGTETIQFKELTDEEIMAQSLIFLLAGYETTASTLTFSTYYLAMNPDMQEEIYQELIKNIPDENEITYDMLSPLYLLEQCLNETLRICPPAPRILRTCTKDTILTSSTGQIIRAEKDMIFMVPVYAIHHDETLWPESDKFDIHRFDYEEKQNRRSFSYMPFGMGPRNCIGMRFALLEAKLALAYLLKNYRIMPCEKTPKKLTFGLSGLTKVKEPVILKVVKR